MQTMEIEQPEAGRGPLQLIRRHPLISFFVIAFAFTWTYDQLFLVLFPVPDIPGGARLATLVPRWRRWL
jgi:hypothetical protein